MKIFEKEKKKKKKKKRKKEKKEKKREKDGYGTLTTYGIIRACSSSTHATGM